MELVRSFNEQLGDLSGPSQSSPLELAVDSVDSLDLLRVVVWLEEIAGGQVELEHLLSDSPVDLYECYVLIAQ